MFKPIKALGQNFLKDKSSVIEMVNSLGIGNDDLIIEIGPGLGFVTQELVNRIENNNSKLIAVELDKRFSEKLKKDFVGKNIEVIEDNILDWLPTFESEREFKIIGSLPYYITSPILHKIVKMENRPNVCVLLMQKEVAEKVTSDVPDSSYLSVFIQTFFDAEYLFEISKDKFQPIPKVDGGVIRFIKKDKKYSREFIDKYEGFLHKGFSNPRKMLNKVFTKEELSNFGVKETLRPQNLDAMKWESFYNFMADENKYSNTNSK